MLNTSGEIVQRDDLQCMVYNPIKRERQYTTTWEVMRIMSILQIGYCIEYFLQIQQLILTHCVMLKRCSFDTLFSRLVWFFILRHGWVIVHFQTLLAVLPNLFILGGPAALAALATAAVFAAEAEYRGHHSIPGCHGVQRTGQKVPVAQETGQVAWATRLHHIYNDHRNDQNNDGHTNTNQDLPARQWQAKYSQRHHQEAKEEVECSKPPVFGRAVPQSSGQPDGYPCEGDRIPQHDTHNVEEEMTKCNLGEGTQIESIRF